MSGSTTTLELPITVADLKTTATLSNVASSFIVPGAREPRSNSRSQSVPESVEDEIEVAPSLTYPPARDDWIVSMDDDPEFMLPPRRSLVVMLVGAALTQIAFFILVPSSAAYAEFLGGSATFSGLVIGIPMVFGMLALLPMTKFDQGTYYYALNIQIATFIFGSILYALAYRASFLYLLLIGRLIQGIGFTSMMYTKRYITYPRIVGIRRRTTLASFLVITQGTGFTAGPFIGGLLFKIGFGTGDVWNGYTSPGWVMAGVWVVYWGAALLFFDDVQPAIKRESITQEASPSREEIEMDIMASMTPLDVKDGIQEVTINGISTAVTGSSSLDISLAGMSIHDHSTITEIRQADSTSSPTFPSSKDQHHKLTLRGWGTIVCICWFSMTCFLILGAFEAVIPIFAYHTFNYTPYASGNFIALGGAVSFPFLFLNVFYARRIQDRIILATGSSLGLLGIFLFMIQLSLSRRISIVGFFVCWTLVALGFNLASTCTVSLLSKQLPPEWNGRLSMAIQYSNYTGRIAGAVWGGAGVKVGMELFLSVLVAVVGVGAGMYLVLWKELKTKTG